MSKAMNKVGSVVVGASVGLSVGCACGVMRTVSALCPVLWPVSGAVVGVGVGDYVAKERFNVARGEVGPAVCGGVVGLAVGTACIPLAPVLTPMMLIEAACMPAVGAVVGGVIGYSK